ncbi:MAG: prepilin-type N-terminal cleavage/methylation domain-containing protein [Candidatus Rokubacteria bacterium]|nr:prepilin-type N-terminal cleavage/methylation domain-containing protein [Candidatus Rokubacteria bacterium]
MTSSRQRGFTLVEVVIALTIVATLLVVMFGSLRVGLAAWQRGDERAEVLDRARSITQIVTRTLGAAHPYMTAAQRGEAPRLLFEGTPDRVAFVTAVPPFPTAVPIAFTAVTLSQETGPVPGLAVRQKPLPNAEPFDGAIEPALVDGTVSAVHFRYLRESDRAWTERWDAVEEKALPLAVEITLSIVQAGRSAPQPPLMVSLPVRAP